MELVFAVINWENRIFRGGQKNLNEERQLDQLFLEIEQLESLFI